MTPIETLLGQAACGGLAIAKGCSPMEVLPAQHAELIDGARSHRIIGLLSAALDDGLLVGEPSLREAVAEHHLAALRTSLRCEEAAVSTIAILQCAAISSRVLKGVAHAHLDYDDPAMRTFGDVDILVPRAAYAAALQCLLQSGYTRDHPAVRGWWERRFAKAVVLLAPNGVEVDLHLTLTGGFYGLSIPDADLFASDGEGWTLAGHGLLALPRAQRLVQAAYHAILGGGSGLRAQRDVAQLLTTPTVTTTTGTPMLDDAVACAAGWNGEAVLALAIRRSWDSLQLPRDQAAAAWARDYTVTSDDLARVASYTDRSLLGWAAEGRGAIGALHWPDRLAYTTGLLIPSSASLQARGRTWRQHVRRMVSGGRR